MDAYGLVAPVFGALSRSRHARSLHPRGSTHTARLTVTPDPWTPAYKVQLLDTRAVHDVTMRVSRGIGLPPPWPDLEGLAVRVPGVAADGGDWDVLVSSAWRYLPAPGLLSRVWSSIVPFTRDDGSRLLLGARPADGGFELLAAEPLGRWQRWARLVPGERVDGEPLRFDPGSALPDLDPGNPLSRLRQASYRSSQQHRP